MSKDALAAAARLFAMTPAERIRTHHMGDDEARRRVGGRPRAGVFEERMKFIRANMHRLKRRQMAAHLGIAPDRVSRYLQIIRRGG